MARLFPDEVRNRCTIVSMLPHILPQPPLALALLRCRRWSTPLQMAARKTRTGEDDCRTEPLTIRGRYDYHLRHTIAARIC
jgi:hypothetical protein